MITLFENEYRYYFVFFVNTITLNVSKYNAKNKEPNLLRVVLLNDIFLMTDAKLNNAIIL